ncbi:DUF4931 domain-containing protein [Longispora urticae]
MTRHAAAPRDHGTAARLVLDDRTGRPVFVSAARAARPVSTADDCPFCPGGTEARDRPAAPFAFRNRWPALPSGHCWVAVHSADHDTDLAGMTTGEVRAVLEMWTRLTGQLLDRPDVATALVFENRGPEAGATVGHPHSQVFGLPTTPAALARTTADCPSCAPDEEARTVARTRSWRLVVPRAPLAPFAVRLVPARHATRLADLTDAEHEELAGLLGTAVRALDGVCSQTMPYHLWVSQSGRTDPDLHLCVDLVGLLRGPGLLRRTGAAELATGIAFTPMDPSHAAELLRRHTAPNGEQE